MHDHTELERELIADIRDMIKPLTEKYKDFFNLQVVTETNSVGMLLVVFRNVCKK
jgi:hypothetical protein